MSGRILLSVASLHICAGWLALPILHSPHYLYKKTLVGHPARSSRWRTSAILANDEDQSLDTVPTSYEDYLDHIQLAKAMKACPALGDLSAMDIERLAYCTSHQPKVHVPEKGTLFKVGEVSDSAYFVQQGSVSLRYYDPDSVDSSSSDSDLQVIIGPGESFGLLDVLFDKPRVAIATSLSDNTTLWKLEGDDLEQVMPGRNGSPAIHSVPMDEMYRRLLERDSLRRMVKRCPVFKEFDDADLERCVGKMEKVTLSSNEKIIQQGDVDGDAMYFVASGSLDCIDETRGFTTVNVLGPGNYFGELALLFQQPRAVSVKASNSTEVCSVWKLTKTDFDEAVEEYPLQKTALQAMKTKYQEKTWWKTLLRMNLREINDMLVVASRPKKKSVSLHSTLSVMVAGMYVLVQGLLFQPRLDDGFGKPQLFNVSPLPPFVGAAFRAISALFVFTGFMGLFRIPKNAPRSRRLGFEAIAWSCLMLWTTNDSNLYGYAAGEAGYTFDAWSWFGRCTILGSLAASAVASCRLIDDALAGSPSGHNTIPLATNRAVYFVSVSLLLLMNWANALTVTLMALDQSKVVSLFSPAVRENAGPLACGAIAYASFGALLSTLQFEKRISRVAGALAAVLLPLVTLWEPIKLLDDKTIVAMGATMPPKTFPLKEVYIGIYIFTVANALRRRFFGRNKPWIDLIKK